MLPFLWLDQNVFWWTQKRDSLRPVLQRGLCNGGKTGPLGDSYKSGIMLYLYQQNIESTLNVGFNETKFCLKFFGHKSSWCPSSWSHSQCKVNRTKKMSIQWHDHKRSGQVGTQWTRRGSQKISLQRRSGEDIRPKAWIPKTWSQERGRIEDLTRGRCCRLSTAPWIQEHCWSILLPSDDLC